MPSEGTPRSSYRFGPDVLADLDAIAAALGLPSRAAAVRYAARRVAMEVELAERSRRSGIEAQAILLRPPDLPAPPRPKRPRM